MSHEITQRFEPYGATLLCEPVESPERTSGGLIIPEQARRSLNQGKIVAVGTTVTEGDWPLGSYIFWTQHSESRLEIDGKTLVLVSVDNVVLKEKRK